VALSDYYKYSMVYLFDGIQFVDSKYPKNSEYAMEDMWVSPGGDAFVVGSFKGVMHYDGEKWKRIPGPWLWKIYGFADQGTAGDMIGKD